MFEFSFPSGTPICILFFEYTAILLVSLLSVSSMLESKFNCVPALKYVYPFDKI